MFLRAWVIGAATWFVVGQAPSPVPDSIGGPIGQVLSTGAVVGFCSWRLRHQDAELKRRDDALAAVQATMIDNVVPALRDVTHAQNETRAALQSMLEQTRRGEYDLVRRWDEWVARRDRDR